MAVRVPEPGDPPGYPPLPHNLASCESGTYAY